MTAELVLLIALFAVTVLAAGVGALVLAALGQAGWLVIVALVVAGLVGWRIAAANLASQNAWSRDDLGDEWRAG